MLTNEVSFKAVVYATRAMTIGMKYHLLGAAVP